MNRLYLLLIPAIAAAIALSTGRLPFKLAVAGLCALVLLDHMRRQGQLRQVRFLAVVAALGMSMVGDYFLSSRRGHPHYFECGIAAFFVAHVGFLRYALANGGINKPALGLLLLVYLPYFGLVLLPAIEGGVLRLAVLLYLTVSCVGLAAAFGMRRPPTAKALYITGIFSIVFSDTLISFSEFLHCRSFNALVLPTYYLAHLAVTASILIRPHILPTR